MVKKVAKTVAKAAKHVCTSVKRIANQVVNKLAQIDWSNIGKKALIIGGISVLGFAASGMLAIAGVSTLVSGALVGALISGTSAFINGKMSGDSTEDIIKSVVTQAAFGAALGAISVVGTTAISTQLVKSEVNAFASNISLRTFESTVSSVGDAISGNEVTPQSFATNFFINSSSARGDKFGTDLTSVKLPVVNQKVNSQYPKSLQSNKSKIYK